MKDAIHLLNRHLMRKISLTALLLHSGWNVYSQAEISENVIKDLQEKEKIACMELKYSARRLM